jgi:hypothetical protein
MFLDAVDIHAYTPSKREHKITPRSSGSTTGAI